jgi:hypothetical protein
LTGFLLPLLGLLNFLSLWFSRLLESLLIISLARFRLVPTSQRLTFSGLRIIGWVILSASRKFLMLGKSLALPEMVPMSSVLSSRF